jgi:hypothetical protein
MQTTITKTTKQTQSTIISPKEPCIVQGSTLAEIEEKAIAAAAATAWEWAVKEGLEPISSTGSSFHVMPTAGNFYVTALLQVKGGCPRVLTWFCIVEGNTGRIGI